MAKKDDYSNSKKNMQNEAQKGAPNMPAIEATINGINISMLET
jgi:hypothetical protein